jgi:tRNA pseudouridine55 synthase
MGPLETIDGVLLLNKPAGLTSNQALQRVKRLLRARKAGHTGSLDPAATGMLPLCFGEATKVCAFLLDADKTYRVTAHLGSATDTGDATGNEIETVAVPERSATEWRATLESFLGESEQVPPMYSALKQGGKRLYKLARQGETVERQPRPIRIDEIELLETAGTRLVFRVHCSKGTYIRSLVEDIAKKAGTVGHTARLHRESVGAFAAGEMLELAGLEAAAETGAEALRSYLLPPDRALEEMPLVDLTEGNARKFLSGQHISLGDDTPEGLVRVYEGESEFLGVGELTHSGKLAPKRVFNTREKNS